MVKATHKISSKRSSNHLLLRKRHQRSSMSSLPKPGIMENFRFRIWKVVRRRTMMLSWFRVGWRRVMAGLLMVYRRCMVGLGVVRLLIWFWGVSKIFWFWLIWVAKAWSVVLVSFF